MADNTQNPVQMPAYAEPWRPPPLLNLLWFGSVPVMHTIEGEPDSPPYRLPATQEDVDRFLRLFPDANRTDRYMHTPDRRLTRLLPGPDNTRTCSTCSKMILPYRSGRCPVCWRSRYPTMTTPRLCACVCSCPPESDDDMDEDYSPSQDASDEEVDLSQAPYNLNINVQSGDVDNGADGFGTTNATLPELLAVTALLDHDGVVTLRPLYAETLDHFAVAVAPQDPASEFSSAFNNLNTVPDLERSRSFRPPFRLELARMIDMGYTRNDLRQRFAETRDVRSTSFLPPDQFRNDEAPATCWHCRRDYTTELRDALTMGLIREGLVADASLPREDQNLQRISEAVNYLTHEWPRAQRIPWVSLCHTCRLPQRVASYMPARNIHQCNCRCNCFDLSSMPVIPASSRWSTSSSNSSGPSDMTVPFVFLDSPSFIVSNSPA